MTQPGDNATTAPANIEAQEYDRRWTEGGYSAEQIGYTPHFTRFMKEGLAGLSASPVRALEVGCGDGYFSGQLANLGCKVTGLDLSPAGVRMAQERYPNAEFRVHDLTQPMPFADATFDFVWCSEVLEHLFSPRFVLEEIRRVLKPGGRLRATVPYHGLMKNLGIALLAFERHYDPEYPHIRFFTAKSLGGLAQKAGLRVDGVSSCGSNLGWRDWLVKTNLLLAATRA